jgi:DNA polymerase-1
MAPPLVPGTVALLAVDGNSLAHRAWHAITGGDDEVGEFVAAGLLGLIASVWRHGPYDALLVAFDHADNHRKDRHPTYKAGRETDPDLQARLRQLADRLAEFGVATVDEPGLEADDLLAAVTRVATSRGWRTDVLSGDRDLTALVGDQVRLLRPRGSMSDLVVTSPGVVRAEYGVEARQYHDFAALRGDPSDGLPGVNGIGPKTAATLLADHGTLDELYANLCYLPTKVERALRDGREVAFLNRDLMLPMAPTTPIDTTLDRAAGFDLDAVVVILEDLGADDAGLARAARRLARAHELAAIPRPDQADVPLPDEPLPEDDFSTEMGWRPEADADPVGPPVDGAEEKAADGDDNSGDGGAAGDAGTGAITWQEGPADDLTQPALF